MQPGLKVASGPLLENVIRLFCCNDETVIKFGFDVSDGLSCN